MPRRRGQMIHAFATRDEAAKAASDMMAATLRDAIAKTGKACAALSGGSTPKPIYEALAARALDWRAITLLQVDERCVPANAPGANQAMLRAALRLALSQGAKLLPLYQDVQTPEQAERAAEALYAPQSIDFALMGMGGDGHTASWFPMSPDLNRAIDPAGAASVIAVYAPGADVTPQRITLTLPALTQATRIALLIFGDDKRARLEHALASETPQAAPILALIQARPDLAILWAP